MIGLAEYWPPFHVVVETISTLKIRFVAGHLAPHMSEFFYLLNFIDLSRTRLIGCLKQVLNITCEIIQGQFFWLGQKAHTSCDARTVVTFIPIGKRNLA